MDSKTTLNNAQEQVPPVKPAVTLDNVPRVRAPGTVVLGPDAEKPFRRGRGIFKYFLIGLVFLLVAGNEGVVIYKYSKANTALRANVNGLQAELIRVTAIKDKSLAANKELKTGNLELNSRNSSLLAKIDDYQTISMVKDSRIRVLEGDGRVAAARVEAGKAQNMVLTNELKDYGEYIRELTAKLVNSLGEQEILVNENLRLEQVNKHLNDRLVREQTEEPEVDNADK